MVFGKYFLSFRKTLRIIDGTQIIFLLEIISGFVFDLDDLKSPRRNIKKEERYRSKLPADAKRLEETDKMADSRLSHKHETREH